MEAEPVNYAGAAQVQKVFWLDIRDHFNFYNAPKFPELTSAIDDTFQNDPEVIVEKLSGKLNGLFKIISQGPPIRDSVLLEKLNRSTGVMEKVTIPLTTSGPGRRSREDDLLITIVGAKVGSAAAIGGRDFDTAFAEFGEIVVPTKPQKHQGTNTLNGNRLVVINRKNREHIKIPDRLKMNDQSFLLKYRGKQWMCGSCNEVHIGACPYLKEFYRQKEEKDQLKIKTGIISDSALRYVESVGLRADVACMSGACTGQIATAIVENNNFNNYSHVIMAGGNNDVKLKNDFEEDEVAKRIDKSISRLESVITKNEQVDFTFIDTIDPDNENISPTERTIRAYFKCKLEKMAIKFDHFQKINIHKYPEKWQDGHPTVKCTEAILNELIRRDNTLLLNRNLLTARKMYQGVDNLWLQGCTGCGLEGRFVSGGFCSKCLKEIDESYINDEELYEKAKLLTLKEFPQGQKRLSSDLTSSSDDNGHNDGSKLAKY